MISSTAHNFAQNKHEQDITACLVLIMIAVSGITL